MNQLALPLEIDPRQVALEYVGQILSSGYTEDRARDELAWCWVGDPGFEIQRGKMYIPWYMCPERRSYKFSDLAAEARAHRDSGEPNAT